MSQLSGKTVWITGASSGIGLALAHSLAARDAKLILSARSEDKLKQLASELPGEHQVLALDLMKPEEAVQQAQSMLGDQPIDVLINNAGVSQRSLAMETDLQVYRDLMEINYFSVIALTRSVLPGMVSRGSGQIVTVSSVAGKVGAKQRSGYSGAKFGVIGFMDCLRAEMADKGVQCLTVCPGFVNTQVAQNALRGDGTKMNQDDPDITGGISAEQCAEAIVTAMEQGKDEVVIGKGLSKLAPTLKRFFPGLVRRIVAKRD